MLRLVFVSLVGFIFSSNVWAHRGRTDESGCHMDNQNAEVHCHGEDRRGKADTAKTKAKEKVKKAKRAQKKAQKKAKPKAEKKKPKKKAANKAANKVKKAKKARQKAKDV